MKPKYKFLEHTADIKFQAYGETIDEAFENAALAVENYIARDVKIKSRKGKVIQIDGSDKENLLYSFLDEILYLLDAENFIFSKVKVKIIGNHLTAELYGDDASRYEDLNHIKSATYAEMYVHRTNDGWEVQAVMDV